jgi:two-component system NtrC family sensor kinase
MGGEFDDPRWLEVQGQAAMGRLLASIIHEVSAPLGSLLSNRDVELRLLDRIEQAAAGGEGNIRELVAACRELARVDQIAGERISKLVRSVKIAARAGDPQPQKVQLNQIVESALELAKTEFRSRITVKTDFGALPEVECHPQLLSQAILNLVTNAGQAIEGEGTITAGTRLEGDTVHIWIADTGPGIQPEDHEKILKQSFTTKPLGTGTGLGLLIVRRIVTEDHGGTVDFESESGRGTTFHIRIPLAARKQGVEQSA